MIIKCFNCGSRIELDLTNVLRQRIEDKIHSIKSKNDVDWKLKVGSLESLHKVAILEELLE